MQSDINTEPLTRRCERCGKTYKTRKGCIAKAIRRGYSLPRFCSRACYHSGKTQLPDICKPVPLEERFWKYVAKTDGCWLWTGGVFWSGYGRTTVKGKHMLAHRAAYLLTHSSVPEDMMVCHDCDKFYPPGDITYRRCVRPDHLFLGTGKDNQQDMTRKGRGRIGEKAGSAKLTEAQVVEIRRRYKVGGISQEKLGKEYGVNQTLIGFIVRGVTWKHLPL